MTPILSVVTSVKDYVEIVHKLIESDSAYKMSNYEDLGPIITYTLITLKEFLWNIISLNWLKSVWDLPIIIPDISGAMISEISVLDGYFHNAFNFLDTPLSYGDKNTFIYSLEKFSIGLLNSLFIFIPTGTAHLITLRRFVIQGLEAGYIAGLGSIAGNILWISSIIFGWRFFVIPWLSLDIFRYVLGFVLLVKYMWDTYNERKTTVINPVAKQKIFLLNFLLALTEQTSIYPFISNISIGSESSLIENFPSQNLIEFVSIHGCYILGLTLGCLSLLHLSCWFWENPGFKIYMWMISSFKVSTGAYYKVLNFTFLYLTMICAISSIPYYGLDYTLTNPIGLIQDDRILDEKSMVETSFLNSKASDRNTRRNRGRHGRRERWKRRIRKYRTFDASLYDDGIYDLFTIEDLNYGFDRFWLRRKMRNHRVRFRFFPGNWMRSFKKQLAKPRLESYAGPRQEFFRILFEQVYHPSFHEYESNLIKKGSKNNQKNGFSSETIKDPNSLINASSLALQNGAQQQNDEKRLFSKKDSSIYYNTIVNSNNNYNIKQNLKIENSTLRKFTRKLNTRIKNSELQTNFQNINLLNSSNNVSFEKDAKPLYSKRWKQIFSKISHDKNQSSVNNGQLKGLLRNFYQTSLSNNSLTENAKKQNSQIQLTKREKQILRYRSLILKNPNSFSNKIESKNPNTNFTLLHPLKFYLQKQQGFERKLRYYTPTIFRKFSIENNAPYFRVMMKRYFYYYKPTLRWERTMKVASMRKARRKTPVVPRKIQFTDNSLKNLEINQKESQNKDQTNKSTEFNSVLISDRITKPTHNYTIVGKRATRYRYQIYKDVLQHWYYSPFNRFLLKLDVDLFIKRQPNSHFLTKNEENLLHLRRFLLSEHYDTLRWYTYMQHYRSMKTKIGGTKSFASGVYNQQFKGTFKKIRHLFAITPSQGDQTVLKFDQPLYNEYGNSSQNNFQKNLVIHEELLMDKKNAELDRNMFGSAKGGKDLLNESTDIVRNYLIESDPIKQNYIKKLIEDKNYIELTQFLYKGEKTRGIKPTTNQKSLLVQEKEYLLTSFEKEEFENLEKIKLEQFLRPLQQDLWVNLLKKWKRKVNDQEFLKNYLQRRVEKREKRKQKQERNLKTKFQRLEKLLASDSEQSELKNSSGSGVKPVINNNVSENSSLTNGIQKALMEGVDSLDSSKDTKLMKLQQRQFYNESLNWNQFGSAKGGKDVDSIQSKLSNNANVKQKDLKNASLAQKEMEFHYSLKNLSKIVKDSKHSKLLNKDNLKIKSIKFKNISKQIQTIYANYQNNCNKFINNKVINIFKPIKEENLKNWEKEERSLNKQKRSRKEFKAFSKKPFKNNPKEYSKYLDTKSDIPLNTQLLEPSRKKRDFSATEISDNSKNWKTIIKNTYTKYFTKKFKRRKSPQRRARIRRNRGVIRKRTLSDSLKREFKNLRRYNLPAEKIDSKKQKIYFSFNSSINKELSKDGIFKEGNLQRRGKQRKQRVWKQKRAKYSQKLRKYKKRRRSVLGKVRILNKQLQRIKVTTDLKNWWWKNFLPNLRATTDSLWQYEKDRQIQQKLFELSVPEILERNEILNNSSSLRERENNLNALQIGNFDSKPLALPEAIKLRENLLNNSNLINEKQNNSSYEISKLNSDLILQNGEVSIEKSKPDIISNVLEASLNKNSEINNLNKLELNPVIPTNPIPFYAGWDESLRKFVVTNRLLSRRDSGYEMNLQKLKTNEFKNLGNENSVSEGEDRQDVLSFNSSPLKGMNAATTLYWQIPFTTYDPDQFFALGLDGFAPLGWRRFQFRHSILKSWLYDKTTPKLTDSKDDLSKKRVNYIVRNKTNVYSSSKNPLGSLPNSEGSQEANISSKNKLNNSKLIYNLKLKHNPINTNSYVENGFSNESGASEVEQGQEIFNKKNTKNIYRRLKKRYRRVKKHPRSPVWFPSGPLLNQVLPVHYIYIFYKRSRLPRDRYIKRRLRKSKTLTTSNNQNLSNVPIPDFTLRKRVKTKRKYHVKQDLSKKSPIIPRRMKFLGNNDDQIRWRPLSRQKLNKPISELIKEQRALKYKQRKKESQDASNKQPTNIRMKQLRRRVQRQIIRSAWRYRPRAGGFVWPGDYLKLELVKAPRLSSNLENTLLEIDSNETNKLRASSTKVKRKKKRNLQEWQIQPKKYLLERHNYNVIKKKLEKAQRSNKLNERIKELNYVI